VSDIRYDTWKNPKSLPQIIIMSKYKLICIYPQFTSSFFFNFLSRQLEMSLKLQRTPCKILLTGIWSITFSIPSLRDITSFDDVWYKASIKKLRRLLCIK
jgi:hypothetical protein